MSRSHREERSAEPAGRGPNRRNHYRILHVQPDAPIAVIKATYRTLLQTMRAHPDLGGDHAHASLINEAYAMLREPERRRGYDARLRARHRIAQLSMGRDLTWSPGEGPSGGNQRNYYRVLHVQRDAPAPVIEASFRALSGEGVPLETLLREAFAVIGDREARAAYDRLLRRHRHAQAVLHLPGPLPPAAAGDSRIRLGPGCPFCHTPAGAPALPGEPGGWCLECHSPLPGADTVAVSWASRPGRDAERRPGSGGVRIYPRWPCVPLRGEMLDLSPTGSRVVIGTALPVATTLKVEADPFGAIARVARCSRRGSGFELGLTFLCARFVRPGGNFLRLSV